MSTIKNNPCASPLSSNFLLDCDNPTTPGIEQKIVIVNVEDVDSLTPSPSNPNSLLTDLSLKSGKTGYEIQGIKQVLNYTNTLDSPETYANGVIHTLAIRVFDPSVEARKEINRLIQGALLHAVVERKNKGVDKDDAFLFFGQEHGLQLVEMTDDANENDGTILLTLSTPAGLRESFLPKVLLETNYATTKTAFDNKFEAA